MLKNKSFPFITSILASIFGLSSCGGGPKKISSPETFSVGALSTLERPITTDERAIATRICYAYQSKGTNFKSSNFLGSSFNFSNKTTDCKKAISNKTFKAILTSDPNSKLIYLINQEDGTQKTSIVQTDTNGYLSQVCGKIKFNQEISNTTMSGGLKVQIQFFRSDLDGYSISYFSPASGAYIINSQEIFKVRTQFDYVNGMILGMDESHQRSAVCQTDAKSSATTLIKFISKL